MNCEYFSGMILDTAAGVTSQSIALERHLRTCESCSERFLSLHKTMDLLDEWRAPEPSSWFDSQLRAKLVHAQLPSRPSWSVFLRPVPAMGLAICLFVAVLSVNDRSRWGTAPRQESELQAIPGSAVGDLQMLDEVDRVSGYSDLLDDLAPDQQ